MSAMCFKCDSQQRFKDSETSHTSCLALCYSECEKMGDSCSVDVEFPAEDEESYSDNEGNECLEVDDWSLYATPPLSPMSNCYWSCLSSFADLPEYLNTESREEDIHSLDINQNRENEGSIKQQLAYDAVEVIQEIDSQTLDFKSSANESSTHLSPEANFLSAFSFQGTSPMNDDGNNGHDEYEPVVTLKNNLPFTLSELQTYENELKNELNSNLDSFKFGSTFDESNVKDAKGSTSHENLPLVSNCEVDPAVLPNDQVLDNMSIYQDLDNKIGRVTNDANDDLEDKDNIHDLDIDQNCANQWPMKQLLDHDVAKSIGEIDIEPSNYNTSANVSESQSHLITEANLSSNSLLAVENSTCDVYDISEDGCEPEMTLENKLSSGSSLQHIYENELKNELYHDHLDSFDFEGTCDESDLEDFTNLQNPPLLLNFEADPAIWTPPEPEDVKDETDSVANNDDDDYGDGTMWVQSSSLHSLNGNAHKFIEERHKAMVDTMNGQFKILVRHFLASEGICVSEEEGRPSWLDIVVSLSWEAADFVKPDASEGMAMDPSSYVKVKCVASGSRQESKVVKGLVFKKNAAHKHMPTNLKNPKLLLLQGALGDSMLGFSSFKSMEQENDHLKFITVMIETCHPNVVLVEKTVSRDAQELLLAKGVTLIFEMKLHRLERIARCIGSPIISSIDIPKLMKLNQCEFLHIEKLVEEHNHPEGGRRPGKTLMFLEGFPKPLGCTILLKGGHSDELKKIKRVLQYTVFAAYHLILETSFFADQKVFCSGKYAAGDFSAKSSPVTCDVTNSSATTEGSLTTLVAQNTLNTPVLRSNETVEPLTDGGISLQSSLQFKGTSIPTYSSDKSLIRNNVTQQFGDVPRSYSWDYHSHASSYFGLNDKLLNNGSVDLQTLSFNNLSHETKLNSELNKSTDGAIFHSEQTLLEQDPSTCTTQDEDRIKSVIDPQSILVLQSRRCITKQVICEENHLSRIKYYGSSDMSLQRFLKDILLNKMYNCPSCDESTDAHVFSYTHKNGNISVLVRQISEELCLPGEDEGKIWMWTRCLKCRHESGIPSTRRVLLSGSACKLSFGKFLEISFSGHSAANRLSNCGHSVLRDSLRFFGLGSKVAVFKYSPVEIYAACKPPPVLEFRSFKCQLWLKKEIESVLLKSHTFFSEVSNMLQNLPKEKIHISGSFQEYSEIQGMLIKERTEFEASLLKSIGQNCETGMAVSQFLGLRWLNQELLLQLYMWDRHIHCLIHDGVIKYKNVNSHARHVNNSVDDKLLEVATYDEHTPEGFSNGTKVEKDAAYILEKNYEGKRSSLFLPSGSSKIGENVGDYVSGEAFLIKESDIECKTNETNVSVKKSNVYDAFASNLYPSMSGAKSGSISEDTQKLCWSHFSELRKELKKDLYGGSLQKFEFINTYIPTYLSPINKTSVIPVDSLHFTVGPGGTVMTASEDEISSIIACALALSADRQGLLDMIEKETVGIMGTIHKSSSFMSDDLVLSASWTSNGSSESDGLQSASSFSSDELPTLNSDALLPTDHIMPNNLHPETPIGVAKVGGKSKFSVVCIYAKEFYKLRSKCCPSELAYISSLSRCKKWDAQGGKSKAFFAKTMDDRFIIKQIKKTELDSFLKFGPDYFKHTLTSVESGSQTCLAKILGIYQVKQNRNGKEFKLDLLVMENLMFGHNICRTYDLKGAMFSRYVAPDSEEVLLDQNFVEDMLVSPIYIGSKAKQLLQRAIWNDTSFLSSVNVMDYSLLVGVDKQRHELVFGIIDYLREYTWDKQLETWVKASIVVPKNELPTIISPKDYKRRFRKFIAKYFLAVPDNWNSDHCSVMCKLCTNVKHNCAKVHNVEPSEQSMRHAVELH